jgi:hypothetical protein
MVIKILVNVMNDLINTVILDEYAYNKAPYPITVLRQYRNLVLTCKAFHKIITEFNTEITILCDWTGFAVWWGNEDDMPKHVTSDSFGETYNSLPELLRVWQVAALRRDLSGSNIPERMQQLGKFYLNPGFELRDAMDIAALIMDEDEDPEFFLKLGPFFEANRKAVTEDDKEKRPLDFPPQLHETFGTLYDHEGYVSVAEDCMNLFTSVKNWKAKDDDTVSGSEISKAVTEWWVWKLPQDHLYLTGYAGKEAWLFNAFTWRVYSNSGQSRWIGKRKHLESDEDEYYTASDGLLS